MEILTVGVVPHPTKSVRPSLEALHAFRDAHGGVLVARQRDAERVGDGVGLLPDAEFVDVVDAVIALGGDGTMLGAMRLVAGRKVPVVGVNYGNVGFLVEIEPDELPEALVRLSEGDYQVEPHLEGVVRVTTAGQENSFLAFNDAAVTRRPGNGLVSADLTVAGSPYGFYQADALVVATSTGSTAYNYSAGGPILSPALAAAVITPVASMAGIDRPLVVSHRESLHLSIGDRTRSAALEIDGRVMADVSEGTEIELRLLRDAGSVLRLNADRHSHKGRVKLSLLDLPLRRQQLRELLPSQQDLHL